MLGLILESEFGKDDDHKSITGHNPGDVSLRGKQPIMRHITEEKI